MDEELTRQWKSLTQPDMVETVVSVRWVGPFCIPAGEDEESTEQVRATFRRMTCEDHQIIDGICMRSIEDESGQRMEPDYNWMRLMMLRRLLQEWTLDIPLERADGWITDACFNRVLRVPAPLIDAMMEQFETHVCISDEEEEKVTRQAAVLFSPSSSGVANACEAVSLFCNLGNFWEKFGLNRFDLARLPYVDFVRLKMMISKENGMSKRRNSSHGGHFQSETKIVGPGGRIRPSRAIVVGRN